MNPLVDKIIERLQGSCIGLEQACAEYGINSSNLSFEDLAEIDNWIFYCDNCGWWYDVGDKSHNTDSYDNICIYCADEENE